MLNGHLNMMSLPEIGILRIDNFQVVSGCLTVFKSLFSIYAIVSLIILQCDRCLQYGEGSDRALPSPNIVKTFANFH